MERKEVFIALLAILILSLGAIALDIVEFRFWSDKQQKSSSSDAVVVYYPKPAEKLSNPYKISGLAKGTWFFEASFPIIIEDENGKEMSRTIAMAMSDWMTEDFVPFEAEITFDAPSTKTGVLVFKKDNPSGLPENDDEFKVPIKF